jgi:hypothetical protein
MRFSPLHIKIMLHHQCKRSICIRLAYHMDLINCAYSAVLTTMAGIH